MFFLDIRPEEAYRRIEQTRDKREMFENLRELQRIRFKALSLASIGHWIIVDANKSEAEIQEIIMGVLEKWF
jgi:thymidylate kinase